MPTHNTVKLFAFLKKHEDADLKTIISETGIDPKVAGEILEDYLKKGMLILTNDGKYRIKFVLNPPLKEEPKTTQYWDYTKIQERLQEGGVKPVTYDDVPRKWRNPHLRYLPTQIDQGDRGTCVGFSTAIGLTLLYFQITGDLPTDEELKAIQRNIEEQLGCTNAKPMVRDNFGKRWKSPQFIYDRSREVGGITAPSGSYLSAAVKAIRDYGSVFETECWTSKSPYCVGFFFPAKPGETSEETKKRIMDSGAKHKTNGYATITDFEAFCAAIYTQWKNKTGGGFGLVPINIYENYTSNGCEGNYPEPNGEVVGSHAQCVVGYDMDAGTIEFRQSWGKNWTDDGGISKHYWEAAAGAAFVILDDTETRVGQELYSRVTISANVPLDHFTINGENHAANVPVVALERGKKYTIVAFPADASSVKESSITIDVTPMLDETSITFAFTKKDIPVPPNTGTGIVAAIIAFLRKIFDLLTLKK